MDIDRLNAIETENRQYDVIDIDEFFDDMDLTHDQIEERKKAARDFNEFVLLVFAVLLQQYQIDFVNYGTVRGMFLDGYISRMNAYVDVDSNLEAYAERFTNETLDTTQTHLSKELVGASSIATTMQILNDSYYLSEARAVEMAVNMSLDVVNYKDFLVAVERGFRHKKWIAIGDKKTRKTHDRANGQVVPIGDYFKVGKALLAYPHDTVTEGSTGIDHLEEISNCRCSFKYVQ